MPELSHHDHDHVLPARLALTELGPTPRCATCHREHNEPSSFLVNSSDAMCVDCHGDPKHSFGQMHVDPVSGFSAGHHPEFKPAAAEADGDGGGLGFEFEWKTAIAELDKARSRRT